MTKITLGVDGVTFDKLWNIYETYDIHSMYDVAPSYIDSLKSKCFMDFKETGNFWDSSWGDKKGKKISWGNYCAVILSDRFIKAGFKMPSPSGPYTLCNSHPEKEKGKLHFIRAKELAFWLNQGGVEGLPQKKIAKGSNFDEKFGDKQGIIYFSDYWNRGNEKSATGDHIDLWNKGRLPDSWRWVRDYITDYIPNLYIINGTTPLRNSKEVWFWELP